MRHSGQTVSRYNSQLTDWAGENGVRLPIVPKECDQSYHMFYLLLPSLADRQALIGHLAQRGILAVFHYVPLHSSQAGQKYGRQSGDLPITDSISERLIRLPLWIGLTLDQQNYVVKSLSSAVGKG